MQHHDQKAKPVWSWENFEPGLDAPPADIRVTRETIANYAKSVHETNPIYFDDEAAQKEGFEMVVAPPTMVFSYSPMRRGEIYSSHGYLGPEAEDPPRVTVFAGTEIAFQGVPVYPGDTITSVTTIDRKWESRSGSKFVAFRIVGHNQRGDKVCDMLYNIVWEYARGSKSRG